MQTRPVMILSSSLLLGALVLPVGAETTGERALLNRSDVRVTAPPVQAAPEGKIDGEQALLNRPAAHETAVASPGANPRVSSGGHNQVSGERALLGHVDLGASTSL
jgi:hypothetical protein